MHSQRIRRKKRMLMTCNPPAHSKQLQSMFIGGHNNGNMDALHTHHAHKTVALSLSIGGYWARQHARRDDSLAHRNIWTRPGGRRKSTGIQTDAASSSEVSQDFRPLVQGAGTTQLVGGFVHAVTALPGVTDNPELDCVCSRASQYRLHIESGRYEYEISDWISAIVSFRSRVCHSHGLAFQAGKGTMPRSFRVPEDV